MHWVTSRPGGCSQPGGGCSQPGALCGSLMYTISEMTIPSSFSGLISEHKYPIVMLQFLNEWGDCQVVPYCISQNSSMKVDGKWRPLFLYPLEEN